MPARRLLPALLLAAVIASIAPLAHADGTPLGPVPSEDLSRPAVKADGHGGALVTYKTASLKVGAIHVNGNGLADGGLGFAPAVMPFTLEAAEPMRVALPTDTQVVLGSDRATSATPVLTSMRTGGAASPGFPVGLAMPSLHPVLVAGLGGRTLIVSKNSDSVTYWTLRAAIIGANGAVQSSVQLSSPVQFFNADRLDATTDGAGGLIAVFPYYDPSGSSGTKDLAVFLYTAAGTRTTRRIRTSSPTAPAARCSCGPTRACPRTAPTSTRCTSTATRSAWQAGASTASRCAMRPANRASHG
jgi:hypothetical protein